MNRSTSRKADGGRVGPRRTFGGTVGGPITPEQAQANFWRWFDDSQVVDKAGEPLVVYHATSQVFDVFEPQRNKDAGFHFGSRAQAEMRGGRRGAIIPVYLSARRLKRVKDGGQWTKAQIAAARRQGYDGIVYLNRYEGIDTERILALEEAGLLRKLDRLSDREFRKVVPEADDSFIVFEPTQIKSVYNRGAWSRTDSRIENDGPEIALEMPEPPMISLRP